jgi:tRNA(adenine34) deaminase
MVTLEGKIRVPQAQREATNAALVEHVALTRAEDGCLFFEVVPDAVDPEGFRVREAFLGPDAFAAHQSRVANSAWGRLTKDFQRQYEVSGLDDPVSDDETWMAKALALADAASAVGEVPVGALVVLDGEIIGQGFNQPITRCDPTAHAEIVALRQAAQAQSNYRLPRAVLYVTIEPCLMCVGAMVHARVARVVFGAREPKAGALISHPKVDDHSINHRFEIVEGVLGDVCGQRMSQFFSKRR